MKKSKYINVTSISLISLILIANMQTSMALGKTKWWTDNVNGGWWNNGITCWPIDNDVVVGSKVRISYQLGQSKKWVPLQTVTGISGGTLVDSQGNLDDSESATPACNNGDNEIAFILPKVPVGGGAFIVKWEGLSKNGKSVIWRNTEKVLGAYTGIQSTSSFFTNPPNVTLPSYVYENLPPSLGIKAYTNSGKPRHACLIFYDLVLKSFSTSNGSIYASDIINSAQGGWYGANIRQSMGTSGGTIQAAIKCAPWIAEYLW